MKITTHNKVYALIAILIVGILYVGAYQAHSSNSTYTAANTLANELVQPNMSTTDILVWANEAAVSLNTYSYLNYRKDRQKMQNYFSPEAWDIYYHTLEKQHYPQQIAMQKMTVSAIPLDVPLVLKQGIQNDRYTWKIQVPLLVNFQNGQRFLTQKRSLTLVIQRTPPYLGKRGIGIVRMSEQIVPDAPKVA